MFHIIIPARLESSRLANKVLLDVAGQPLIARVYEQALNMGADSITIASDHADIIAVAQGLGADTCLTGSHHSNGTERLAEAVAIMGLAKDSLVLNLQADEPLMPVAVAQLTIQALIDNPLAEVATVATRLQDAAELFDPNAVKVVLNRTGGALYFSRAPIPWVRGDCDQPNRLNKINSSTYRHMGLYAYRVQSLQNYASLSPSPLEALEALEQLRLLWHGLNIQVALIDQALPAGVDTAQDLERVRHYYQQGGK